MQLKALITTLLLGSSSVALAAPQVRDHRTPTIYQPAPAPVAIDRRVAVKPVPQSWRRPVVQTWMTLANDAKVDGRRVIEVGKINRTFTRVALRAAGNGRTKIDRVQIIFGNGQRQTVELDAKLNKKSADVSIDLQGNTRNIDKIVLIGKSNRNASVDVLAL